MGHSDIGSRKGGQGLLHCLLGRNIQMICRLVQYQKVCPRQHQLQKSQTGLLPTGKLTDNTEYIIPPEQKCPQISSGLLLIKAIFIKHFIQYCTLHVKPLMLLGKIANLYSGANFQPSSWRFQLSYQQAKKGSLSSSIRPHNGYTIPLSDKHINVLKKGFIREFIGNVLQLSHPLGTLCRSIKGKIIKGRRFCRFNDTFQTIQLALTPPGLLGFNTRLILADIILRLFYVFLLLFVGCQLGRPTLLLHLHVVGVITFISSQALVFNFKDTVSYLIQKESVMGNNQHTASIALQKSLQPLYHLNVQMVGGLIQK